MRDVRLPFFDFLLERFGAGDQETLLAFGRHVHWGYWPDPHAADGSVADFANAAERLARYLCDAARVADGSRVLDCGCGFGGTIASMNERFSGLTLVGLNVDPRQLARARTEVRPREGNRIDFVRGDGCQLPFADASFDVVLAIESIFHFVSRGEFFREARRVLRPGGRLVLSDFVPRPLLRPIARFGYRLARGLVSSGYADIDNACTLPDYRMLGGGSGFTIRQVEDVTANTLPTYPVIRRIVHRSGPRPVRAITALADWVSEAGIIRYALLTFEASSGSS